MQPGRTDLSVPALTSAPLQLPPQGVPLVAPLAQRRGPDQGCNAVPFETLRTYGNPAARSRLTHLESLDISLEDELEVAEDDEFATVLAAAAISAVIGCAVQEGR